MKRIFIGDVHGKFGAYRGIIKKHPDTIQVGDMGVGFITYGGPNNGHPSANPPYDLMKAGNHRFIRGNHDSPSVCRRHSQFIKDGTVEDNMMFVGGALSIDRAWRQADYNWWADEELSISEFNPIVDVYYVTKPDVMITHDCPEEVAMCLMNTTKLDMPSRTRQALQCMFELHQPKVWVFGHWHYSFDKEINRTRFVCLNELEVMEIDT